HAAADGGDEAAEVDAVESGGVHQRVEQRVDAQKTVWRMLLQQLHEAAEVTRIGHEEADAAAAHAQQAVRGQRKDVIQRQREIERRTIQCDLAEPGLGLQYVRDHVSV